MENIETKLYLVINFDNIKDIDNVERNTLYKVFVDDELIYIGKTKQIRNRIKQHLYTLDGCLHGIDKNRKINVHVNADELSDIDLELYETYYIHKYKPPLNKSKAGYIGESKLIFPELDFEVVFVDWKAAKINDEVKIKKERKVKPYKIREELLISLYKRARVFTVRDLIREFGNSKDIIKLNECNKVMPNHIKNAIRNLELHNLVCEIRKANEYFVKVKDRSKIKDIIKINDEIQQ